MGLRLIGSMALFSLTVGCASGPAILVDREGISPPPASFSLLDASDPATAPLVRSDLEAAGWQVVERGAPWRVDVLRTQRDEQLGAFTSSSRPATSDAWVIPPAPRRWWRSGGEERSILIAVLDGETGEWVAWARARTRRPAAHTPDASLAAGAVAALLNRSDPSRRETK